MINEEQGLCIISPKKVTTQGKAGHIGSCCWKRVGFAVPLARSLLQECPATVMIRKGKVNAHCWHAVCSHVSHGKLTAQLILSSILMLI